VLSAVIFSVLTAVIGYEALVSLNNGVRALGGFGVPRLPMGGLMNLVLAAVMIMLGRATFSTARQHFFIWRMLTTSGDTRDRAIKALGITAAQLAPPPQSTATVDRPKSLFDSRESGRNS
jgi:hypothetical protein